MDYQKHYNLLINRAQTTDRKKYLKTDPQYIYYEKHHIIPRCLGGSNNKENIVLLTPAEHFVAHQLLVKIYPSHHGILYAAVRLTHGPTGDRVNNKLYSWLRKRFSENSSGRKIGPRGPLTKEHKAKISAALKDRPGLKGEDNPNYGSKRSEETKKKMSENHYFKNGGVQLKGKDNPNYGLKRSQDTRDKISTARTGGLTGLRSEETKQKMKVKRKLQTRTSQKSVVVFGIQYSSLKESCDKLGKNHKYIIKRLRDTDCSDCYYL